MTFRRPLLALLVLTLLAPLAPPALAQMIPPHPTLRDFEPIGEYMLQVAGGVLPGVKLFRSDKAGSAVLFTGQGLRASYLIMPREKSVNRVDTSKVVIGADGRAFVLADAAVIRESKFTVEGAEVAFTVEGKPARLKQRPYLLGLHAGKDLLDYDVGYAFLSKQYTPSPAIVRALRQANQPVRVRVFFGSWCPHCHEMVPRILRVGDALVGSTVHFEYYGLPSPFGDEPEAKRMGINAVPTGVIYRGNRELGRIEGEDWRLPELAIKKILDGAGAAKASR